MEQYIDIDPTNNIGQFHGYNEWYNLDNTMWYRGYYKNGFEVGYVEINLDEDYSIGQKGTRVQFYIR